jgi:hemerythrin-like domain-containing protein
MGWRKILEKEHRLMLEVADATDKECAHIEATGEARIELAGEIIGFFRYFCDGLHDPKEDGLLFARCHKRGMTNDDEPLEQMLGEHEWCSGELDALERRLDRLEPGDREGALAFASHLREYVSVLRCHVEVEESVFFDTAQHYLTEEDRRQLTEEFEAVHWDEVEEGVVTYWEDLAHHLIAAENQS